MEAGDSHDISLKKSPGRIGWSFSSTGGCEITSFLRKDEMDKWWEKVYAVLLGIYWIYKRLTGEEPHDISNTWVYCWIPDVFWISEMHAYCYWNAPQTSAFSGSKHLLRTRVHPQTYPKYTLHSQLWSTWITTKGDLQKSSEITWQTTRPIHTRHRSFLT